MEHTTKNPDVGIMLDLETLGRGPRAVVTQVAMVAFEIGNPARWVREVNEFLPIQPQLGLRRDIDASTLIWWMQQSDDARSRFKYNEGHDLGELESIGRSIVRKFNSITQDGARSYEVWARGPQFDAVILESLLVDLGLEAPWKYDTVRDLRTLMKLAGVDSDEVDSTGITPHVALDDCKFQIRGYELAFKRMSAR